MKNNPQAEIKKIKILQRNNNHKKSQTKPPLKNTMYLPTQGNLAKNNLKIDKKQKKKKP